MEAYKKLINLDRKKDFIIINEKLVIPVNDVLLFKEVDFVVMKIKGFNLAPINTGQNVTINFLIATYQEWEGTGSPDNNDELFDIVKNILT